MALTVNTNRETKRPPRRISLGWKLGGGLRSTTTPTQRTSPPSTSRTPTPSPGRAPSPQKRNVWTRSNWREQIRARPAPTRVEMPRFTVSRSGINVQPGTRAAQSRPNKDVWTKDNWRDRIQERTAPPRVEKPRFTVTGSGIRVQTAVEREIQEKAKREFDDRTWNTRLDARQRRFDVDQQAQDVAFRRQLDVETVGRALERQGAKLPHLQRAGSEALSLDPPKSRGWLRVEGMRKRSRLR